jgi:hypothetical protein
MITAHAYDLHVENLFEKMRRVHAALSPAGIPYRIIGGMGVFLQVSEKNPDNARLTRDVDVAVLRADLERIKKAAEAGGFRYRHAAGVDMLVDASSPRAGAAVHLVFAGEKVRPEYAEPIPFSEPTPTAEGILIASVADLLLMKLTSFRLKDKVHVQDMDAVGLITPEIEGGLPEVLRGRLAEVRSTE